MLGVSYRQDVGDTRYSGAELIVRRLAEMGANIKIHDPYVEVWPEIENQEEDPDSAKGYGKFFARQANLRALKLEDDMWESMSGVKAIVITIPHSVYLDLDPDKVFKAVGRPFAMIDCFCILDDAKIRRYLELGCEVKGMGRGHIKRIKESIRTGG